MVRRLLGIFIAVCLQTFAAASAQPDSTVEIARALYEKGQRQYDLGHFADALHLFESAYETKAAPALLFNIAQCHRQLGDLRNAAALYRSFLRADPDSRSAGTAQELLAQVDETLRGRDVAHEAPAAQRVPAEALSTAAPAPPRARVRWPAIVAGGTAAALLAAAVAESFAAHSASSELAQLHQQDPVSPAEDARLRADADSKRSRATILYVAAAVAAVAGAGLYFTF